MASKEYQKLEVETAVKRAVASIVTFKAALLMCDKEAIEV